MAPSMKARLQGRGIPGQGPLGSAWYIQQKSLTFTGSVFGESLEQLYQFQRRHLMSGVRGFGSSLVLGSSIVNPGSKCHLKLFRYI